MGPAFLGIWLVAAIVTGLKGKGRLLLVSVIGGVASFALLYAVIMTVAFGVDPDAGTEAAGAAGTVMLAAAYAAPIVSATRLAKPWSPWARRRYDAATMRLATGRYLAEADRRGITFAAENGLPEPAASLRTE